MQRTAEVVPARAAHIRSIADRMRQTDCDEVLATSNASPLGSLMQSFKSSDYVWTGLIDGNPEVMFGARYLNVLTNVGCPWLLGTDAINENSALFLRSSVWWRDQLLARYAVLRNVVDCRNAVSIRWLGWLGFEFSKPFTFNGHDFMVFEMRRR